MVGSPSRALGVGWDVQEGRQGGRHCSFKRQGLSRKHCDLLLIVLWVAGALMTRDESKEGMRVSAGPPLSPGAPASPRQHQRPLWPSSSWLWWGPARSLSLRPWDQVGLLLGYSEAITNGPFILLFYRPTRRPTARNEDRESQGLIYGP